MTLAGCQRTETAAAPARAAVPPAVSVVIAQGIDEPITVEATGSFEPDEASEVAPDISGRVIATPVDAGDFVKEGAVLIRIQDINARLRLDEVRAAAARAEANLELAEARNQLAQTTAARNMKLLGTGLIPQTVADEARTQAETAVASVSVSRASLAEARAQLAVAEKAVADVVVTAPFSGYISRRRVAVGEYVQPSSAVVTLLRLNPLRLRLTIPAVQAGRISAGQRVTARVDSFPDQVFEGRVTAINPAIAAESRAFSVEARVPNPDARLKPGMFAVAAIEQGRTERAVLVPQRAIVEDVNTNSYRAFVVDDENRARLRIVQLAARHPQPGSLKVLGGISENERVATSQLADLYDGMPVSIAAGAGQEP
jgi:RND family efflux transporter MFP subunit